MIDYTQIITAALSGGGVSWAATWLNERSKSRSYTMGAVDQAVKVALESVTIECQRLNKEIDKLRSDHRDCRDKNDELEAEIDKLRKQLDELMNQPSSVYHLNARPTPKA